MAREAVMLSVMAVAAVRRGALSSFEDIGETSIGFREKAVRSQTDLGVVSDPS
jgi:hypothetical protein